MGAGLACDQMVEMVHEIAEAFGHGIDAKDPATHKHSRQVATLAGGLAMRLMASDHEADVVHFAGHLHDIGKLALPDAVLHKPGPLAEEEWSLVRRHPETGARILSPIRMLTELGIPRLVLCHHERFDGRGYPFGLRGEEIPLGARILSVADALVAMMEHRVYRRADEVPDWMRACDEVACCAGRQFDPLVVATLLDARDPLWDALQNPPHPHDYPSRQNQGGNRPMPVPYPTARCFGRESR